MQPRIERSGERKLVGKRLVMSLAENKTFALWQSFMPRRKEIKNVLSGDLFSMQVYPPLFDFADHHEAFEKWAAVEVANFNEVPADMETFVLQDGLYAVFEYKGLSTDPGIFEYIFKSWLPGSNEYELDQRPHFEILGAKYKNNDPNSEEEIWIPVKPKH